MNQKEIEHLTVLIAEKERDLVVYEQAMVNFSAMLSDKKFNPAILKHGSERTEGFTEMVYNDIKNAFPRDVDIQKHENELKELKAENYRLKHRSFLQRILNK